MDTALYLVFGLVVGALIGWFLRAGRHLPADTRVEDELRKQRDAQEEELNRLRTALTEATCARVAADTAKSAADDALNEERKRQEVFKNSTTEAQEKLQAERDEARDALAQSSVQRTSLETQLTAERKSLAELRSEYAQAKAENIQSQENLLALEKRNGEMEAEITFLNERLATERQQIETIQEKFQKEFEAISNKLFLDNSTRFNDQSAENLTKLLTPLKETLGEFKTSLETTRTETATHSALLKEQINRIGAEAANLSKALKGDVKVLGNWGENMLDQILEKSGLQRDLHYRRQQAAKDADGDQRFLDVIVELPEKRNLIIDSKVSLRSYEESLNGADDGSRAAHLVKHVDALRSHFRGLGSKRYQDIHGVNAPDFVLMYVPIEAAFFSALAQEPSLFVEALDHNVVLITNSSLLATLRTVAHVWRLADQQKHALEIADRGGKLYDKFVGFIQDLEDVGAALKNAHGAWELASNKLHTGGGNLIRQVEQLKTLGAKAVKSLPSALLEKATESPAIPPQLDASAPSTVTRLLES